MQTTTLKRVRSIQENIYFFNLMLDLVYLCAANFKHRFNFVDNNYHYFFLSKSLGFLVYFENSFFFTNNYRQPKLQCFCIVTTCLKCLCTLYKLVIFYVMYQWQRVVFLVGCCRLVNVKKDSLSLKYS